MSISDVSRYIYGSSRELTRSNSLPVCLASLRLGPRRAHGIEMQWSSESTFRNACVYAVAAGLWCIRGDISSFYLPLSLPTSTESPLPRRPITIALPDLTPGMPAERRSISIDLISLIELLILFILFIAALIQNGRPYEKKPQLAEMENAKIYPRDANASCMITGSATVESTTSASKTNPATAMQTAAPKLSATWR